MEIVNNMPRAWRTCCVNGCNSKQRLDNSRTFFKFRTDDSWMKMLENNYNPNIKFICDLHFDPECFHDDMLNVLQDGEKKCLKRQRLRLKKNALPTLFKRNEETTDKSPTGTEDSNISTTTTSKPKLKKILIDKTAVVIGAKIICAIPKITLFNNWNSIRTLKNALVHWSLIDSISTFVYFGDDKINATRSIKINDDMSTEVRVHGRVAYVPFEIIITSVKDLLHTLEVITALGICQGHVDEHCKDGLFIPNNSRSLRCNFCRDKHYQKTKNDARKKKCLLLKKQREKLNLANLQTRCYRSKKRVESLKIEVESLKVQMESMKREKENEEKARMNHNISEGKSLTGRRYSKDYILKCIMLKNKSRLAYRHLITYDMLPLPSFDTLSRWERNLKLERGSDVQLIEALKMEQRDSEPIDSKDAVFFDEIEVSETFISSDTNDLPKLLKIEGTKYSCQNMGQ